VGLEIDDVVPEWEPKFREIFAGWRQIHSHYEDCVPRDGIWWCSERSNVSALASASWLKSVCALEEYRDDYFDRRHRVDLWLDLPGKGRETIVETKFLRTRISASTTTGDLASRVEKKLRKAEEHLENLEESELTREAGPYRKIAACFVVPRFAEGTSWDEPFRGFVEQMREKLADGLLLAWHEAKQPLRDDETNLCYPGVLLLGRLLPRR
jgi:hypothetical protein